VDPHEFVAPEAGRVVVVPPTGYLAFVPAPLPPDLTYDASLVALLSRADAALGELAGRGAQLPNAHLLISPYLRREAVLSSRIEGTQASLSDIMQEEAGVRPPDADIQEVRNYVTALEYGLRRRTELPLSLRLVREMHEQLMQGVRGEHATPGQFRRSQNWINGSTPDNATYVPPPPDEMQVSLADWEQFLHWRGDMPELVQCALIHEQFEAIHPFLDGNGRIGRLLIPLFLVERGRLSQALLYLSAYFESNREEYYRLLQRVRTHGDWNSWIRFFLRAVEVTARAAETQSQRLLTLREEFRAYLAGNARALALVDNLFVNPYTTIKRASNDLGSSTNTARRAIQNLIDAGIVEEVTGRSWGRAYFAHPIMAAIEDTPTESAPVEDPPAG